MSVPSLSLPHQSTLSMIGNTPMLKLSQFDTGCCELFLKLENQNPGGSIKDRIALKMVEAAEVSGELKPGGTIIEATAGNTGLGLALIAALKHYRLIIVMPDKMSQEKVAHLRALGAEVRMTRSDVVKGHPDYYQDLAARLQREIPGAFYINQFENPNNPKAHETTTAPEIWNQLQGRVDAFVYGIGSSGGITGIARYLKQQNPEVDIIAADPEGSIIAPLVERGVTIQPGSWVIEGIGEDFVPKICDLSLIDGGISISDQESLTTVRELLRKEGILAGSSTGTHLAAALKYCRAQTQPKRVVTIACDTGNKYLSKQFNDQWMQQHGFLLKEKQGDLRDWIAYPQTSQQLLKVSPEQPLRAAIGLMQQHGVSQVAVWQKERVIGLIREPDVLQYLVQQPEGSSKPVTDCMQTDFSILRPDAAFSDALTLLLKKSVVLVRDGDQDYGLITPIDAIGQLQH